MKLSFKIILPIILISALLILLNGCFSVPTDESPEYTSGTGTGTITGIIAAPCYTSDKLVEESSGSPEYWCYWCEKEWNLQEEVLVILTSGQEVIATTTTDEFGVYTFTDVPPGENYIITAYHPDDGIPLVKDVVPELAKGESFDAKTTDLVSTSLGLVVDYVVYFASWDSEDISLDKVMAAKPNFEGFPKFKKLIREVRRVLENCEDVDVDDELLIALCKAAEEISESDMGCAPGFTPEPEPELELTGGTSTPEPEPEPEPAPPEEEIEFKEVVSKQIDLEVGGVIEVTDETSEIYGTRLIIDPVSKAREIKEKGLEEVIILLASAFTNEMVDYQGFLITPVAVRANAIDIVSGTLEITYDEDKLSNSGVAKDSSVNVYRLLTAPVISSKGVVCYLPVLGIAWEKVPEEKLTHGNNKVNISIDMGDFIYLYTLTVTNCEPPSDIGNPLPGDLVYRLTIFGLNDNWLPGHVGIYVGERYHEEDEEDGVVYNVIEQVMKGVERSYFPDIARFGNGPTYMGAREPINQSLTHINRNIIVDYVELMVGMPYAIVETFGVYFGWARGDFVKGFIDNKFNCVGLAERAYEIAEVTNFDGLVSDYDEGNQLPSYDQDAILSPQEQLYRTVPASGIIDQNAPPEISSALEMMPGNPVEIGSQVTITCNATDQDKDRLTYKWSVPNETKPIIRGKELSYQVPSVAGNYTISCKVIDNYGGEDTKEIEILVGTEQEKFPEIGAWTITGYDPYCIKTFGTENIPDRSIVVYWLPISGAEEYRVYRSVNGDTNFNLVYSGDGMTGEIDVDNRIVWYDFDTTPGNSYSYKVSCVVNGQENIPSDVVTRSVWLPECSLVSPQDYDPEDPNYQPIMEPDPLLEWNPVGVSSYPYQGDIQSGESQIWVVVYNTPYPEVNQGEQIWNGSFNDLTTSSTRFDPSTPLIPGPDSIHAWESKGVGFDDNGNILAISWSGARHFFYMEAPDVILPPVHNLTQNTYYDTIQGAIDDADSGDNIEVSPGTYYENINFLGKDITLRSTDPDDPSVVESTIIDGGGNGNVIIFSNNETAQAVLNGFTIQDGTADYNGGGIWVIGSSPTIKNNTITRNLASDCGGGIGVYEGSPLINDNIITNNTAEYCGGGIWISDHSSPTIENNTIAGNTATLDSGGGIHIYRYSSSNIRNNAISNNTATNVGGGIGISDNSSPTIEGNTISNNSSANNGGGLYIDGSSSVKTTNGSTWPRQNTPPNTESTNTYSDNTHGNPLDYTEGADVYMEGAITPINGDITNVSPLTDPFTLGTWYTTYVYVENTGNTSHTFKVIASEPSGTDFEITEKFLTIDPGATKSVPFTFQFYGTETCRSLTFYLYDNSGNLLDTKQTGTLCPITLNAVITNIRDIVAGSLIDPFELNKWYTAVVHISVDYNGPDSGIIEVKPKPDSGIEYDPIVKEFPYDKYTLGGSRGFDYKFVGSGTTRQLTFELYDQATGIKLDEYTSETLHLMQPDPNLDYIESIPSSTNLQCLHPFGFPQDYVIKAHFDDGHIETWTDFNKFNFESSDIYIVNVHENYGSMYGTGVGTATITITYKEDTSKKASLSVTVY